jgi:hypothetical protein
MKAEVTLKDANDLKAMVREASRCAGIAGEAPATAAARRTAATATPAAGMSATTAATATVMLRHRGLRRGESKRGSRRHTKQKFSHDYDSSVLSRLARAFLRDISIAGRF